MRCRRGLFLREPGGLPLLLLAGLLCLSACNRRRPLPRSADAGPSVELVERRAAPAQVDPALLPPGGFADEREPNDDRDHAQPIDAGKGLRGSVLPPAQGASGKGDDDFYSYLVQAPPASSGAPDTAAAREVTVVLTGGPTADLALEVLDGEGRRLLSLDERKKGEPESLAGLVLPLGQTLYLRVRPSPRMAGRAEWPGADASYQLLVNERPAPQGSEIEPNDTPEQATAVPGAPLGQGVDLSGRVLGKKDEDWFALAPAGAGAGAGDVDGGQRGPGPGPGSAQGDILRIELTTPGVTPALRLLLPGAPGSRERRQLLEVRAPQGSEELMLRNVSVPEGVQGVLLHLRALSLRRLEAGSAEARYQLRVTREPKLEGAEVEPNDACAQATPLPQGGDAVAGFLWPGDVDCFRLPVQAPTSATFHLTLPPGECQAELLPAEGAPGPAGQGAKTGTGKGERLPAELTIEAGGPVFVRVAQRGARACFAAPYRLSVTTQPVPAP